MLDACATSVRNRQHQTVTGHRISISLELPRAHRLTPERYRAVFDGRRRWVGRYLVLWALESDFERARIGVVASRRTFRRAVDRNRARRLLRESFRLSQAELRGGVDFVLVARAAMRELKRAPVMAEFQRLCVRAGYWEPQQPCSPT